MVIYTLLGILLAVFNVFVGISLGWNPMTVVGLVLSIGMVGVGVGVMVKDRMGKS